MIELTMLPGQDGDCLLLRYGAGDDVSHVLVDGGRASTYPAVKPVLAALEPPRLDVVVVTHVDQDHVLGVLALVGDPDRVEIGEVWFNGYDHLLDVRLETFGARDGELLTTILMEQHVPWNVGAGGRAVQVGRALAGPGDATYTVVAPDRRLLERLAPAWVAECRRHGLIPGVDPVVPLPGLEHLGPIDVDALAATRFVPDSSLTNATSIAFLFEHDGVRILFTGDGDDRCIAAALRPLAEAEGGRLRLDALKVAHHGSAGNLSRELLELLDCPRYLISTNGARHGHPDDVTIARILVHGGERKGLFFNYRDRAATWQAPAWQERYGYTVTTPSPDDDGTLALRW